MKKSPPKPEILQDPEVSRSLTGATPSKLLGKSEVKDSSVPNEFHTPGK